MSKLTTTITEAEEQFREAIEAESIEFEAFKIYLDNDWRGIDENWENHVEGYLEAYDGYYETEREWVEHIVEDSGFLIGTPENVKRYFDYESYARDLFAGGEYWETNGHYFRSY